MDKKRILIVHSTLHIGGAEEVTANLCKTIDKEKFDIKVCYLKEKGTVGDRIEDQGTPVIGLPRKTSGKTDYLTSLKLRKTDPPIEVRFPNPVRLVMSVYVITKFPPIEVRFSNPVRLAMSV